MIWFMVIIFILTIASLVLNYTITTKIGKAFELLINKFIIQNQEFYKSQGEQIRVLRDDIIQLEKNIRLIYSNNAGFSKDMKTINANIGRALTDLNNSIKTNVISVKAIVDSIKSIKLKDK